MDVQLSEEQTMLQDSVAKFCKAEVPLERVRELAGEPSGLTDELWNKVAEQGWIGLIVPEAYGGLGLGVAELAIVCEEMGRNLLPGAFLSTALTAHAMALGATDAVKTQWLEKMATGEAKGALALIEEDAALAPASIGCTATATSGGYTLSGKKFLVEDGGAADVYAVLARTDEGDGGLTLFAVDRTSGGVSVAENKLNDQTRRSAQVTFDKVSLNADALIGEVNGGWDLVDKILQTANVCLAAESIAGAEFIHKLTIGYAKERTQFGKVIGSFQAVKHPLVNVYADLESARSAYHYAAWAVDAGSDDARSAAAVARLTCTKVYKEGTLICLQAHGGIAFTWEYDLHLYLKRAIHNESLYGTPRDYEEIVVIEALGI